MTRIQDEIARAQRQQQAAKWSASHRKTQVQRTLETISSIVRSTISAQRETAMFKVSVKWHNAEDDVASLAARDGEPPVAKGPYAVISVIDDTQYDYTSLVWDCMICGTLGGGILLKFTAPKDRSHLEGELIMESNPSRNELDRLVDFLEICAARYYGENSDRLRSKRPWW